MLKSRGVKQELRRSVNGLGDRLQVIVFAGFMLFGVFVGSVMASSVEGDSQNVLKQIIDGFIASKNSGEVFYNFCSGALSNLSVMMLLFFCGFCAISTVIIITVAIFKGVGIGLVIGSLYAEYSTAAINYILLKLLPDFFICNIIILISCSLAYSMARGIALRLKGEKAAGFSSAGYLLRFFILAVCMLSGCWFNAFAGSFFTVSLAA